MWLAAQASLVFHTKARLDNHGLPQRRDYHPTMLAPSTTTHLVHTEDQLLALLDGANRGAKLSLSDTRRVGELAQILEAAALDSADSADSSDSPLLPGRWRVLFQGKPDAERVAFFDVESWRKYLLEGGPSPVQALASNSGSVGRLYQILRLGEDAGGSYGAGSGGSFVNVVDFSDAKPLQGVLAVEATLEGRGARNRLTFRFRGGRFVLRAIWGGALSIPYPVPFDLLGDEAVGWLQTDYLSPRLRLSRGNRGSLFVLAPELESDDASLQALLEQSTSSGTAAPLDDDNDSTPKAAAKQPVIIAPAQFGREEDYADLVRLLEARGHPTYVAPLVRRDWLRLLPASLTAEYWKGELEPDTALHFYYEALEKASERVWRDHGAPAQIVGHSIGGWIARAYLGQLSGPRRTERFSALVTLGTPHAEPPEGLLRKIDQTRGLLKYVNSNYPGAAHPGMRYLSVGSTAVRGRVFGAGLDGLLGFASYLPLGGDGGAAGDGICPEACSVLAGAEHRTLKGAHHIAFVPFLGLRLLAVEWYGSDRMAVEWADFLE